MGRKNRRRNDNQERREEENFKPTSQRSHQKHPHESSSSSPPIAHIGRYAVAPVFRETGRSPVFTDDNRFQSSQDPRPPPRSNTYRCTNDSARNVPATAPIPLYQAQKSTKPGNQVSKYVKRVEPSHLKSQRLKDVLLECISRTIDPIIKQYHLGGIHPYPITLPQVEDSNDYIDISSKNATTEMDWQPENMVIIPQIEEVRYCWDQGDDSSSSSLFSTSDPLEYISDGRPTKNQQDFGAFGYVPKGEMVLTSCLDTVENDRISAAVHRECKAYLDMALNPTSPVPRKRRASLGNMIWPGEPVQYGENRLGDRIAAGEAGFRGDPAVNQDEYGSDHYSPTRLPLFSDDGGIVERIEGKQRRGATTEEIAKGDMGFGMEPRYLTV